MGAGLRAHRLVDRAGARPVGLLLAGNHPHRMVLRQDRIRRGGRACAAVWLKSELLWEVPYSHPFIPFWNALVRLAISSLIALLTSEINIRTRAESALRDQTKILSSLLDCVHDGVVVLDKSQQILLSNPAAHRFFGDVPLNESASDWIHRLQTSLCKRPNFRALLTFPNR